MTEEMQRIKDEGKELRARHEAYYKAVQDAAMRRAKFSIISLFLMLIGLVIMGLAMGGCAAHTSPYTVEYAVDPPRMAFSTVGNGTKVVRIYNPFPHEVAVDVWCPGNIFEGHSGATFRVPGNDNVGFLVQESNRDLVQYDTCQIRGWHFTVLDD